MGISVLHKLYLEAKLLPWQPHNECYFAPCLMYITSAKFEEHRSNISRDILHFVICLPLKPLMTSPVFNKNLNISWMRSNLSKTRAPFFFRSKGLPNKLQLFFYFIGTLKALQNFWRLFFFCKPIAHKCSISSLKLFHLVQTRCYSY